MKKINWKKCLIAAGVVALCAICILTVVLVVRSRSSQVVEPSLLEGYTPIELQKKCYFVSDTGKDLIINGEGTFTISAVVRADKVKGNSASLNGDFIGHMSVSEYPVQFEEVAGGYFSYARGDLLEISSNGLPLLKPDFEARYDVSILISNPDIIKITIYLKDGDIVHAICGETEEEAKENYRLYWEQWEKSLAE